MSDQTNIEWCSTVQPDGTITKGATWNPTTGCTKISPGCAHCYIERTPPFRIAGRRFVNGHIPLLLHENRTRQPLHWKQSRRIFVNSLSDLFHQDVPDQFLHEVYATMEAAHWHQFQILTKRPERMRAYLAWRYGPDAETPRGRIPSRHIWHGVSVENQRAANERIPLLLQTPAAVRFISAEPLLERVLLDNGESSWLTCTPHNRARNGPDCCMTFLEDGERHWHGIDWVVVGGESGPKSRRCDLASVRSIVAQCRAADVPVFVKQLGAKPGESMIRPGCSVREAFEPLDLRDKKGGGDMDEWPPDLRIREFPSSVRAHA